MVPVIRIDEEVWKQLQKRATPLTDTPNDVLRRTFGLDEAILSERQPVENDTKLAHESGKMMDSIFIVVNAAGPVNSERLVEQRVNTGVDMLRLNRFIPARKKLKVGARIVMYQGGGRNSRGKYPAASCLVAAGKVKNVARELTKDDEQRYHCEYQLTKEIFEQVPDGKPLVGIIFYEFPKGMAKEPLPAEEILIYLPNQGRNYIEIKPADGRNLKDGGYQKLDDWWKANS